MGKIGFRINRQTGKTETDTNTLSDVRGSYYTAIVITRTIERNSMLVSAKYNTVNRKNIRKQLTCREDQLR